MRVASGVSVAGSIATIALKNDGLTIRSASNPWRIGIPVPSETKGFENPAPCRRGRRTNAGLKRRPSAEYIVPLEQF
jgi:hypothetical protein